MSKYNYFYFSRQLCRGRTIISCGFGFHAGVEVVVPAHMKTGIIHANIISKKAAAGKAGYALVDNKFDRYVTEAFLALLHQLAEMINMNFEHFAATNDPNIYLSLAMHYESVFEKNDYGWFNSDLCLLYINAARICNRNKDYDKVTKYFEKSFAHGADFMKASK